MIYTVVFITNQQLRDIKLEGILNPDFTIDKYIHEGSFDFSIRVSQNRFDVWSYPHFKDLSIQNATKWKTIRGAENALKKIKDALLEKRRFRLRGGNDSWQKNEYIPVICNITGDWNSYIKRKIKEEEDLHRRKIDRLTKKLAK